MLDLVDELRSLVAALDAARVEFALCGGLALAVHVAPRATLDVDLLVPRAGLDAAKEAARGLGYRIEGRPLHYAGDAVEIHRLSKPDPETGDLLPLDLLVVTPAFEAVWASRERVGWAHGTLPVVSRDGLVAMKRLRGSGQDQDDILALEENDGTA